MRWINFLISRPIGVMSCFSPDARNAMRPIRVSSPTRTTIPTASPTTATQRAPVDDVTSLTAAAAAADNAVEHNEHNALLKNETGQQCVHGSSKLSSNQPSFKNPFRFVCWHCVPPNRCVYFYYYHHRPLYSSSKSSVWLSGNSVTSLDNSGLYWTVFARNRDTAVPAEENGELQTLICVLVSRPRRCPTLSNPVLWQSWMAAYPSCTLQMKTLFPGWLLLPTIPSLCCRTTLQKLKVRVLPYTEENANKNVTCIDFWTHTHF